MQIKTGNNLIKAMQGDKNAFGKLVAQHQQYAFNLAFRMVCNEEDARDIVQDSFVKIWKNIKAFDPQLKFTTWMYKIITHSAIDYLRSAKRASERESKDFQKMNRIADHVNPETQLLNKELGQWIEMISGNLPEKQRLVFVLKDLQGLSNAEIVNIIEMPETSVKSNLYHARRTIREQLSKIYEERKVV